jgi:hypothetical protein
MNYKIDTTKNTPIDVSYKKQDIDALYTKCIRMLDDFGFSGELYIIEKNVEHVDIHFDDKGAVEYFRDEAEKDYPDEMFIEYIRKGKRHCARVSFW